MTYVRKENPSDVIEYLACSGVDAIVFRTGKFSKELPLKTESPSRIYAIVRDELNEYVENRRLYPGDLPSYLTLTAYDGLNLRMCAEWEDKKYRIKDADDTVKAVKFLVFKGMTIFHSLRRK